MQTGPTDLRHFDPTLTCIPPTLSDLVTTERSLHVDKFDYVVPDGVTLQKSVEKNPKGTNKRESENGGAILNNSTDEEKAMKVPLRASSSEGEFVEGKVNEATSPLVSKQVVSVDVHPNT